MAEFSGIWTTEDTTPVGDQVAGYTQAHWADIMDIMGGVTAANSIARGYMNELEGLVTGANTVQINTGGGLVDGKVYRNDAPKDINIPSAVGVGNTRIDRIVLRCTWANFKVRLYRIAGVDAGLPTPPTIIETSGSVYDLKLYQALVDTSGNVVLTDERDFPILLVDTDNLVNDAVNGSKIADNSIDSEHYVDGSIDEEHLAAAVSAKLVTGGNNHDHNGGDGAQIPTNGIANNAVTPAKLSSAAFPTTTAGDMLYASAAAVLSRLPKGTAKQVLMMNAGATAPEWGTPIVLGFVHRTGEQTLTGGSGTWVDITSFTVNISMPVAGTILAFASGTFRAGKVYTGAAIRIVIDGTNSEMKAEKSCNSDSTDISWVPFSVVSRKAGVAAGTRTIKVQLGNVGAASPSEAVFREGSMIVIGLPGI